MSDAFNTFCAKVPKCELHVHIEGTLEPAQARFFAERNQLPVPEEIPSGDGNFAFHDLPSFLRLYYAGMSCLRTSADFSDLVFAYLTKAHSQNVVHTEMFFDPQAHTSRGIAFETVISGLVDGVQRAKREYAISAALIMCFLRDHSAESAAETLQSLLTSPHRSEVMGIGLDSDEKDNPPRKFANVFAKAKEAGFHLTMHCDADQEHSLENIRQAIHEIGVERIDHGVNAAEDQDLMTAIIDKGIGLTCCPLAYATIFSDFKSPQIDTLYRRGVKVTIASDDPSYFAGYVGECLRKMGEAGWNISDIARCQKNAIRVSWLPESEKVALLQKLDAFMSEWSSA